MRSSIREKFKKIREFSTQEIKKSFENYDIEKLSVTRKEDDTFLTKIDQALSDQIKEICSDLDATFYSEEDFDSLDYPAVVVDPIDGTRELVFGINECSVSVAYMHSSLINDPLNEALVFNPFNLFNADSTDKINPPARYYEEPLMGLVSRSEWKRGLHNDYGENFIVSPKGSIAYKLGLLSRGMCDFVITKKPKNIWDIAAGTILCAREGISMYFNGEKVTHLNTKKYDSPIVWARDEVYEKLKL